MIKNIISAILLASFLINVSFAESKWEDTKHLKKKIILTKSKIKKEVKNGTKYVITLDKYLNKYGEIPGKLHILTNRIKFRKYQIQNNSKIPQFKQQQYILVLDYFIYRAELIEMEDPVKYNPDLPIRQARDSARIAELKYIENLVEQIYQDHGEYPAKNTFLKYSKDLLPSNYKPTIPIVWDNWYDCNDRFGILYEVGDINGIPNQAYRLSTCMETKPTQIVNSATTNIQDIKESFYIDNLDFWSLWDEISTTLESYIVDARNSKTMSNIRSLANEIELYGATRGSFNDIIIENESDFKSNIINDPTYKIWNVNFDILDSSIPESSNKFNYQAAYIERSGWSSKREYYQILWLSQINIWSDEYKVVIKWNYTHVDGIETISLFAHPDTWEILEDWKEYTFQ